MTDGFDVRSVEEAALEDFTGAARRPRKPGRLEERDAWEVEVEADVSEEDASAAS